MKGLKQIVYGVALVLGLGAAAGFFAARRDPPIVSTDAAIEEIAASAQTALNQAYPEGAKVLRAAHSKAHGCVKASVLVDPDLPESLRVGSFAMPGKSWKALIRFSNSAFLPGPDAAPNGRGLALKLLGADHDLLFINYPVYFLADLQDFLAFARAGGIKGDLEHARAYFFPGYNPFDWRFREASIVFRNATRPAGSPLDIDYWSMMPYAFGAGRAVKYSVHPCGGAAKPEKAPDDPDYLRHALRARLQAGAACLELFAQERPEGAPLDDATRQWSAPERRLARIEIPAQDLDSAGRADLCENLSFNPARAPAALAPLGGVNAARQKLYERSRALRMDRNHVTPTDPEKAWEAF